MVKPEAGKEATSAPINAHCIPMNQKVDPRRVPQDRQGSQEGHRRVGWRTEGMAKDQGDLEGGNRRRTALKAQQGSFVVAASTPKGAGKGKEGWECGLKGVRPSRR